MNLVLSTDAKLRLKWTAELHQQFVEAVAQLGGEEKATPKSLMKIMGIPGLTLYHLKSHLQKYRMGKNTQMETNIDSEQDYTEIRGEDGHYVSRKISNGTKNQMNDLQITQALQMQLEVQRKLHEQIEVQRHLQLRIEAQGKYLQSVLKKAQETLSEYNSSSLGAELTKAELSRLVQMVNSRCENSSFSELTEVEGLSQIEEEMKQIKSTICSMESSLTSSESSGRKEEKQLPLTVISPEAKAVAGKSDSSNEANERKRRESTISDDTSCVEQQSPSHKENKMRKLRVLKMLDLNCQYQNDTDSRE